MANFTMYTEAHRQAVQLLMAFLIRERWYCPSVSRVRYQENVLLQVALRNKIQNVLFHFLDCAECRKNSTDWFVRILESYRKKRILYQLLFAEEKRRLQNILRRKKLRAVLYKSTGPYFRKTLANDFHDGSDMDVLIEKKDIIYLVDEYRALGYKKMPAIVPKEVTIQNPANFFEIDLHYLLAYPHYGGLSQPELTMLRSFTTDFFSSARSASYGLFRPSQEYMFLSLLIRFWFNDTMTGLGELFKITKIYSRYVDNIRWGALVTLADTYAFRNECMFILKLGSLLFQTRLPQKRESEVPFRVTLFVPSISVDDVAIFPPIRRWYHKRYNTFAHRLYLRYFFLKLWLNQNTDPLRLLRPRIVVFLLSSLMVSLQRVFLKHQERAEIDEDTKGMKERRNSSVSALLCSGSSMWPFFHDHTTVMIVRGLGVRYRVGDIVVFQQKGMFVVHRIVAKHRSQFVLKGDGSTAIDGVYRREEFIGRATGFVSRGRYISLETTRAKILTAIVALWSRVTLHIPIVSTLSSHFFRLPLSREVVRRALSL